MKKFIKEALNEYLLSEIDWENDFKDVKKSCPSVESVVEYLNKVKKNADKGYEDREKFDAAKPFVHSKSSFIKKGKGGVDIDFFIKQITSKPNNIINTNDKILKTGGPNEFVYKTGIPALRGIAYDLDKGEFVFINTCPGAGSCIAICYARKGNYVRYPASYDSMTRRLNYLLNFPDKYEAQMYEELKSICEERGAYEGYKPKVLLRWNDSGDFFTKRYVKMADNTIKRLKKEGYNVDSYLYTKVADVAKDSKFGVTSFSAGANKQQSSKIDPTKQKMSMIVPSELFKGLDLMKISDIGELKSRVADFFQINKKDVITYDELMHTPEKKDKKLHVIVTPDDGDDAAKRRDVKTVLLTQH
jgi:hypothetical protein